MDERVEALQRYVGALDTGRLAGLRSRARGSARHSPEADDG